MASDGTIGTLLGVLFGALLGYIGKFISDSQKRRQQELIAVMVVATNLRHWIGRVSGRIAETRTHISSGGAGGTAYSKMPQFRFETALEQVSLLDIKTAKKIFDLIYDKDIVNASVRATFEYQSNDEAIDTFLGEGAKLCIDAAAIYEAMLKMVGWTENALSGQEKENLKREIDLLQKIENQERHLTVKLSK